MILMSNLWMQLSSQHLCLAVQVRIILPTVFATDTFVSFQHLCLAMLVSPFGSIVFATNTFVFSTFYSSELE